MKYYYLLMLSSLLLGVFNNTAQARTTKGIVKVGAGVANLLSSSQNDKDIFNTGNRFVYQAGLGISRQFTEKLGLQAEVLYLKQGATFGRSDSVTMSFNSAGIAVLLLYRPWTWLEFEVGALPNLTLSVTDGKGHDLSKVWDSGSFDAGLLLGMRYLLTEKLSLNPRFHYGLLPRQLIIFKTDNGAQGGVAEYRYHHINAQLSLEYRFDL